MNVTIVGGNWDEKGGKKSGAVELLEIHFSLSFLLTGNDIKCYNGGNINDLPKNIDGKLIVWMPNIENEIPKYYPSKGIGSCLIVSKVVRDIPNQHKYMDAVSRIFAMSGNAVIAIEREKGLFKFTLIDALGNIWSSGTDVRQLQESIIKFYDWHKDQQRISTKRNGGVDEFLKIVNENAKNVMNHSGNRYFGNCSTRCTKTFPSCKLNDSVYLFSSRNVPKETINADDMVLVVDGKFVGSKKPSLDTPVQIELYKRLPNINCMIHGHAFLKTDNQDENDNVCNVFETKHYYPCGDMREVDAVMEVLPNSEVLGFMVNLKGHGYLIGAYNNFGMTCLLDTNLPEVMPFREIDTL